MKRIILCFDGTWNSAEDDGLSDDQRIPTNVERFYKSIRPTDDQGVRQSREYIPGVGTNGWDRLAGGFLGAGLDRHIREGYSRLVQLYEDGDEVYIVGFSRGAYTARSLVGMIRNSGLVTTRLSSASRATAHALYRARRADPWSWWARGFRSLFSREIPIKFLGVWDTVGALGIPLELAGRLNSALYQFHDTELSSIVERAYHAVAIDEHRADYTATLWDPKEKPGQHVEQRWFAGAHCDVGGGYKDQKLSDLALRWMQDRAAEAGLGLDAVEVKPENYAGTATDSYKAFLRGVYARMKPRHLRTIAGTLGNETIDESVELRRRDLGLAYAPANQTLPPLA